MKNILQIIPSKTWGGGEGYIYHLSKSLMNKCGCEVVFAGRRSKVIEDRFSSIGKYLTLPFISLFDIYTICHIAALVKKNDVGVVHVHIFQDAFLALFAKKIFGLKDLKVIMTRHLVRRGKFSALYRWLYGQLDALVFVSELARKEFLGSNSEVKANICLIYNSILPKKMEYQSIRELYHIHPSTKIIGYTGRIAQEKGIDTIIATAKLLKDQDVVFLLAGTGDNEYSQSIRNMIDKECLGDKVKLVGFLQGMDNFTSQVDIVLLPSVVREAGSLAVLEAMYYSKPVIATNNGSQREIITNGKNGFLICPHDSAAATKYIKILIDDTVLYDRICMAARERAGDFSYERFLDEMLRVYSW